MRLWYLICLKLLIDNIIILINESNDVTYHLEYDPNWEKSISYSICCKLSDIFKNQNEININQLSDAIANHLNQTNDIEIINLFIEKLRSKDYYINRGLICIIKSDKFYNNFFFKPFEIFAFNNEDLEFLKFKEQNLRFNQIIIYNLESPYSNCKIKKLKKFKCSNNCNRMNNKLSKYYYHGKEINSNQIIKIKFDDNVIKNNETKCLEQCSKQGDCKLIYFEQIYTNRESNAKIFRAYPLISKFDYLIQFIGLIFLICNLSIAYLFMKLIKLIEKQIKKRIDLKNYSIYFKIFILLILISYQLLLFYQLTNEYLVKRDYPIRKEITTAELELKSINLVICLSLVFIPYYKIRTFSELENLTSKLNLFDENVKNIYLEYQNKKIKANYKLNDKKILFRRKARCYQIEINVNQFKYQNQLSITKLIIEFNKRIGNNVYLLSENENFNYRTYKARNFFLFIRKEIKRSKLNRIKRCKHNLRSKWDQINNCLIRKYIDNNQNISFRLVVDKDQFTNDQWTKLSINYTNYNIYNIVDVFEKYFDHCNNYSKQLNCFETEYIGGPKINNPIDEKFRIELNYDVIKEIEEEPSIYKLLMDLLNIESILFGLNIFKLITILFNFNKIKFKYNKLFIYLLCLIGFSYHLCFIFNEILNGELIYSQHYELKETFKIPNLIFCLKYDENLIDLNHKLTYKYLDQITNQININLFINKINYLTKSNEWNRFNYSNIDTFYFLDKKCFEIKFNLEYELDQFQFEEDYKNDVIEIKLNKSFIEDNGINFIFRIPNTIQFGKMMSMYHGFEISIELMEINYDDKFNLIKNPLSILYGQNEINNVDKYLNNLIDYFEINYNLVTLNLPLNNADQNLSIEDQLFDQLYLQIQNQSDYNRILNQNFKRTFIHNNNYNNIFTKDFSDYSKYLLIDLIFFKKIIKITNEDNYTKLFLNLLNLVSLWLDLSLFDLEIYLDLIVIKIKLAFILMYELLIKIDNYLYCIYWNNL